MTSRARAVDTRRWPVGGRRRVLVPDRLFGRRSARFEVAADGVADNIAHPAVRCFSEALNRIECGIVHAKIHAVRMTTASRQRRPTDVPTGQLSRIASHGSRATGRHPVRPRLPRPRSRARLTRASAGSSICCMSRTSTALPDFASRRGVPPLWASRLRMPVRVPGPEPRCFTFPWPAPRIPSGPAAALHGVSIEIRGRYPCWSRRRVR